MKKLLVLSALIMMVVLCMTVGAATYGNLTYTVTDGIVTITGCSNSTTTVEIPSEINNCPVKYIGASAFSGCTSLKSITIPDSVTSISYNAFYNCLNLTKVIIPKTVISIDKSAFNNSKNVTIA